MGWTKLKDKWVWEHVRVESKNFVLYMLTLRSLLIQEFIIFIS